MVRGEERKERPKLSLGFGSQSGIAKQGPESNTSSRHSAIESFDIDDAVFSVPSWILR